MLYTGQKFNLAKSFIDTDGVLGLMVANGRKVDCESDANLAIIQYLEDMRESFARLENERAKKQEEQEALKKKLAIQEKRSKIALLTAEKTEAVKRLETSIKNIIISIPDEVMTDEEKAILRVEEPKKKK
jgi:hypothetical protein